MMFNNPIINKKMKTTQTEDFVTAYLKKSSISVILETSRESMIISNLVCVVLLCCFN